MKVKCITGGQLDTNCYLLINDDNTNAILIDPGFFNTELEDVVKEYKDIIGAVLLTHMHFDHIIGLRDVKKYLSCPVYIHSVDAFDMQDGYKNCFNTFYTQAYDFSSFRADVLLNDMDSFSVGDLKVLVLHTPGHTNGGVCYLINDCLFTGDTLFKGSVGNPNFYGGDASVLMQSVSKLSELQEDYCVFPGHGEETTLYYEKKTNPYMRNNQWTY